MGSTAACSKPAWRTWGSTGCSGGADLTLCTGLAKLRYLERCLTEAELDKVRWRNAAEIFPAGSFGDG